MQTVVKRSGDPFLYLWVMNEWYCFNPDESLLGSGAMGDVYMGYRCQNGMPVAVKKVKDEYANNPQIRERAKQEASLAFRHPNLVEMVGYCEVAPTSGPIFLISHYVEGENVDKYVSKLQGSPQRVEKICLIISSVLDALAYVHSRGVIHRDIKPSNIMVENSSNVRLMDLGIARMNGGNQFSMIGFIGTPEYASPEQIAREQNGGNVQINATTDIYALGITFYELLTGTNPMRKPSDAETLTCQMKQTLPSSSDIPRRLMQVILKATEKDQNRRFQTAIEFKQAIEAALQPEPTLWERFQTWLQKNWIIAAVALSALLLIVFLIIVLI